MFLHRKATLAVIKVISSSPKSELNFVMTSTWFFFFLKNVLQEFYLTGPDLRKELRGNCCYI